jgi:peptide/nickel transport system permease protein
MSVFTPQRDALTEPGSWPSGRPAGASGRMLRTVVVTLVNAVLVAAFVVVVTFFLIRYLLGDPAYQYAMAQNGGKPPALAAVAAARAELGINSPILTQFWHYAAGLLHGSLGNSFQPGRPPVTTLMWSGFSTTLVLTGFTVVISAVLGTLLGLWLAAVHSRFADNLLRLFAMTGIAAPSALVGLVLIYLSAALGGILPAGGWGYGYPANFRYLALPVITLCIGFVPVILRVVRERARAVLAEEHIEAARTRGTPPLRLMFGHVLPECLVPLLHFIALNTAWLLSGVVVVEVVFGIPGVGRVLLAAITADDYPTLQACAMLLGFVTVLCFAVARIAGAIIDPRTRQ